MPGGMRRKPTLLKLADDAGYRTCQVTVPWTYPSETLRHGVVVPGWDAPDESFASTHPEAMAADLSKIFERAPRRPPGRCGSTEFVARQRANVDLRTNICDYLLNRWDPQIFMTVFPEPDQATHLFWASREVPEVVLEAYELVDSAMGKILSAHRGPNDSVLVVSDHGGGPLDTYVHVGKSLADGGFLRFADEPARHVDLARRLKRSVWYRTPPRLRQGLLRRISKKARRRLSSTVRQNDVDWGSSIAFPRDDGGGAGMAIDINVEGKFSRGSVSTRELPEVRERVALFLSQLRDPDTASPVFSEVLEGDQLYGVDAVEGAPDLQLVPAPGVGTRIGLDMTEAISRVAVGGHRREAVFVSSRDLGLRDRIAMREVLPRALRSSAFPVAEGSSEPTEVALGYSALEAQEMEERLKGLGYIE